MKCSYLLYAVGVEDIPIRARWFKRIYRADVVQRPPGEEQLIGLEVNLLNHIVPGHQL